MPVLLMPRSTEVLAVWQGMGYNRRAIAVQACARKVMDEYNGILPSDAEALKTLPGIGHATACSIAAFAFNRPVVFIETNIRRVFIHFFFLTGHRSVIGKYCPLRKRRSTGKTREYGTGH